MLSLTATTQTFALVTTSTSTIDYTMSAIDLDVTTGIVVGDMVSGDGTITTATDTTVVAAPAASTRRQLKSFTAMNAGTAANTITIQKDISGTERLIARWTLQPGEWIEYVDTAGWKVCNVAGTPKSEGAIDRIDGRSYVFHKVGTAAEAIGAWYSWGKDAGQPGAWAPGAPGMTGRATDGTTASDAGCLPIPNAASGSNYLTGFDGVASAVGHVMLSDWMWINSGIVTTTTTAQAVNSVAFPARDDSGTVNGEGCEAFIYVSVVTGNVGAVTTMTLSYTNSAGTPGRTATMATLPATGVAGTLSFFQLQAGDAGIRSIQSVTLGTSLVSGTVHLGLLRTLASRADAVANVPAPSSPPSSLDPRAGVRLYSGSCLLLSGIRPATTATNIYGNVFIATK